MQRIVTLLTLVCVMFLFISPLMAKTKREEAQDLMKKLAKSRDERYSDWPSLAADVDHILDGQASALNHLPSGHSVLLRTEEFEHHILRRRSRLSRREVLVFGNEDTGQIEDSTRPARTVADKSGHRILARCDARERQPTGTADPIDRDP